MADDSAQEPPEPQASPPTVPGRPPGPQADASPTAVVGLAIQSLARAARSFTLYDPRNAAVKLLVADYREKAIALGRCAPVVLEVLAFEIRCGADAVYRETDRERSLSFRLFRDGVRKLRFEPGVQWEEFVTLLEVLSVRSVGVRQQEEDLITLLRKAHFDDRDCAQQSGRGQLFTASGLGHAVAARGFCRQVAAHRVGSGCTRAPAI